MPSLNLDLPQDTLNEVSRLAQKLNVHRVDIFIRAIAKLQESYAREQELSRLQDQLAEAGRLRQSLEQQLHRQRATTVWLGSQLKRATQQAAEMARTKSWLVRELPALRQAAAHSHNDREAMQRQLSSALADAKALDERDRQKIFAVMRDQEVKKLRRHAQEVSTIAQELEKEIAYQRMDGAVKAKKIEKVSGQLEAATKQKKKFEADSLKQQKESFKSERQIGRLMQERAKLRQELQHLARLLNRSLTR